MNAKNEEEINNDEVIKKIVRNELMAVFQEIILKTENGDECAHDESAFKYKEMEDAYMAFCKLTPETRKSLSNVFEKEDFYSFISSGMQWDNIQGMYHYLKNKIIENDNIDQDRIYIMLVFFFNACNNRFDKPMYSIISPKSNEKFNSDIHIIRGNETDGVINELLLFGYVNNRTNKIVERAMVTVKE